MTRLLFLAAAVFFAITVTADSSPAQDAQLAQVDPYLRLPVAQRQSVEQSYQKSIDLMAQSRWKDAQTELRKLHQILPGGYRDSMHLADLAKKLLDLKGPPPQLLTAEPRANDDIHTGQKLSKAQLAEKHHWIEHYENSTASERATMYSQASREIDEIVGPTFGKAPKNPLAAQLECMRQIERLPGVKAIVLEHNWAVVTFMNGYRDDVPLFHSDTGPADSDTP